jgi:hypothetical protein
MKITRECPNRVRFDRRRESQPTGGTPSVAEVTPTEFTEPPTSLAPQIERFFGGGSGVGGTRIGGCGPIKRPGAHAPRDSV